MEFYQDCWGIVREDLVRVFNKFHANGKLAKGTNSSYIALIPKKPRANNLNNFCPISLVGSLYKILAKVLAKRMKRVMGKLIGATQSDFIKDRYILDGVVVLNEAIEDVRKTIEKRLFCKVDFAKAFNSVNWKYLLDMMKCMNFPEKWIMWIKECITTAKANVLVNGSLSGKFTLKHGI